MSRPSARLGPRALAGEATHPTLLDVALAPLAGITVLRDVPPFTQSLRQAVAGWRFVPGAAALVPGGRVLVFGFRQPVTPVTPARPPS